MTITVSEYIPAARMAQFDAILRATGGRYLYNPTCFRGMVRVQYELGDAQAHMEAWRRCTTPVVEVRRDQRWRVASRRIKAWLMRATGVDALLEARQDARRENSPL